MPSVVQTQTITSLGFMHKEKSGEPIVAAFTAVNGRASPPSPHKLNGMNGMNPDTVHVRPFPQSRPEHTQDQKTSLPRRDHWTPTSRGPENGAQNGHYSVSPSLDGSDGSAHSPAKRKRSSSAEDDRSYHSPTGAPEQARRRLDSYVSRDSPNTVSPSQPAGMEHHHQRSMPPMDRAERERNWHASQSQEPGPNGTHYRDSRAMENSPDSTHPNASQANGTMDLQPPERSSTTEITRAGVQVDPKKRKRQFANRTKTGCGTCRRRKKKCDEAKPDCNNCIRGGFICEGYAHKVPWPKNGTTKPHPPLQAKDRYTLEPAQLYHSHGAAHREGYPEPGPNDGARTRPIVVEEHERQPHPQPQSQSQSQSQSQPQRNGWNNWSEPPRPSHAPEHSQPPEYAHPPPTAGHGRPLPNEQYPQHPSQGPPSQRQHNPRIYHHTPQTMSQVVNTSPGVTAEAQMHHPSQPAMHHAPAPPPTGPPGPPPAHYAPPPPHRRERSEKDKMLTGEPFAPYHESLLIERNLCKKAIYRFNATSSDHMEVTIGESQRRFEAIVKAHWIHPHYRGPEPHIGGHVGAHVFVDTPFHCDYGYNLIIEDLVTIGPNCKFLDSAKIRVGRNTRISANVTIDTQRIPTDSKSEKGSRGLAVAAEVKIGENVYIGPNVTILAGVKIGTGAIIHPGSVVTNDIPRDTIARGNPANVRSVNWDD